MHTFIKRVNPIYRLIILGVLCFFNYSIEAADSTLLSNQPKKLVVRGVLVRPPLQFINEKGNEDGFCVDLIKALTAEMGYSSNQIDLKIEEEDSVLLDMSKGKVDIIMGIIFNPTYTNEISFSLPVIPYSPQFIIREEDIEKYNSLSSLKGKKIIVQSNSWCSNYAKYHELSSNFVLSSGTEESLRLLMAGKGDIILEDYLTAYFFISKNKIAGVKFIDLGIPLQRYAFASPANKLELISNLNVALQTLKTNGKYDELYNKWFGVLDVKQDYDQLIFAFIIIMGIVLVLLLFIWLLRSKINSATKQIKYSNIELELAIKAGNIMAWTYDTESQRFTAFHGNLYGEPFENIVNLYSRLRSEDIPVIRKMIRDITMGFIESANSIIHMRRSRESDEYRIFEVRMVRLSASKSIVGSLKDITDDVTMRNELEDYRVKSDFIVRTNGIVLFNYELIEMNFCRLSSADNTVSTMFSREEYLDYVHPDDIDKASDFINHLDMGAESHLSAEYRMLNEDNTYDWFSIEAVAYKRNELGTITSYLGLRRNNTKWKLITEDLIELRDRAESSNRLKSAFLANMSHEIRTPLNAIVGFSDLITQTDDIEEVEQYKSIVRANNELLLRLVNDILDLSKIEAGFIELNYSRFNLPEQLTELHSTLSPRAPEGVKLILDCPETQFDIYCDRNRIAQIITNFVTNAFKFTESGSVTISMSHDDDDVLLKVIDTGIGISEENRAKVFERFEKINEFAQGTGLGLSICQSLVETMHGEIGVESELNVGSTFWFRVPFKETT